MLVRYPNGIDGEFFYQKRAPQARPDWIEVVELRFPSGRAAEEVVPRDAAALAWMANLACLELHPHPVRAEDLEHPDELRVDLDPVPGVTWQQVREVASVVNETLSRLRSHRLAQDLRLARHARLRAHRAALELRRSAPRRARARARSRAPRAEARHAASGGRRSATACSSTTTRTPRTAPSPRAYSVRPTPDARVSAPLAWDEVDRCEPGDFTLATMPARFKQLGDLHAAIDEQPGSLEGAARAVRARAGAGRRALAAALQEAGGRARRACSPPKRRDAEASADRDRPRAAQGRCARGPRALEEAPSAGGGAPGARRRAGRRDARPLGTWTRIRINLQHVPEKLRPASGAAGPR